MSKNTNGDGKYRLRVIAVAFSVLCMLFYLLAFFYNNRIVENLIRFLQSFFP